MRFAAALEWLIGRARGLLVKSQQIYEWEAYVGGCRTKLPEICALANVSMCAIYANASNRCANGVFPPEFSPRSWASNICIISLPHSNLYCLLPNVLGIVIGSAEHIFIGWQFGATCDAGVYQFWVSHLVWLQLRNRNWFHCVRHAAARRERDGTRCVPLSTTNIELNWITRCRFCVRMRLVCIYTYAICSTCGTHSIRHTTHAVSRTSERALVCIQFVRDCANDPNANIHTQKTHYVGTYISAGLQCETIDVSSIISISIACISVFRFSVSVKLYPLNIHLQ